MVCQKHPQFPPGCFISSLSDSSNLITQMFRLLRRNLSILVSHSAIISARIVKLFPCHIANRYLRAHERRHERLPMRPMGECRSGGDQHRTSSSCICVKIRLERKVSRFSRRELSRRPTEFSQTKASFSWWVQSLRLKLTFPMLSPMLVGVPRIIGNVH